MKKMPYLIALLILLGSACRAPSGSIVPAIPIEIAPTIGSAQTRMPSPLPRITATPTPTITPIPSAYAPTNATAAPPQAAGQIVLPPTPTCETHTAAVQVQPSTRSVRVGQQLIVRVTLLNQGCVALGLPQYTLRVHAPQGQPLFNPPQLESVTHGLAVAPRQSDSVEFVLQAAQVGSGGLQATVSFEVHIGYPGPAYWGDATSEPVNIAVSGNLKPPDNCKRILIEVRN